MRINSSTTRPAYLVALSSVPAARPAAARQAPQSVDRVEISAQGKELDRLKKALDTLPDVRPDRVALARQQMQYGPYRVDPVLLAKKMMNEQPLQGDDL